MIIGIPAETKSSEKKVALTPYSVKSLTDAGNVVIVEKNAGINASFRDSEYINNGAEIVQNTEDVYQKSDIIVKINQPQASEYDLLKEKQSILCFFDLFSQKDLTQELLSKKITSFDIKRIKTKSGIRPIESVVKEITGKSLVQLAANILEKHNRGKLIHSVTGLKPLQITIIGAGTIGTNAAYAFSGLGCNVTVADINLEDLQKINNNSNKISAIFLNRGIIEEILPQTDILICACENISGKVIIKEADLKNMKKGSIIFDTGLETGNAVVETMDRILPIDSPIYEKSGILHYCNNDITSVYPNTVSSVISDILTNYLLILAENKYLADILKTCEDFTESVLTYDGNITEDTLAEYYCVDMYELSMLTGF